LDNPIDCNDNCHGDIAYDKEIDNGIDTPENPEQGEVSVASNVHGMIRPVWQSKRQFEQWLLMVNALEIGRNTESRKSWPECFHMFCQHLYLT
jgi:hypothetical protein